VAAEYARILNGLQDTARLADACAEEVLASLPVDGLDWDLEGSPNDMGAVGDVMSLFWRLDQRLFPLRLAFDATRYDELRLLNDGRLPETFWPPEEMSVLKKLRKIIFRDLDRNDSACTVKYAFGSFLQTRSEVIDDVQNSPEMHHLFFLKTRCEVIDYVQKSPAMHHVPGHLWRAVAVLMKCHNQVLRRYRWEGCVTGEKCTLCPWTWEEVPRITLHEIELLKRAAARLGKLAEEELTRIARVPHETRQLLARKPRLQIRDSTILLDGQPVPLDMIEDSRRAAVCFLTHLLAAEGDWRSMPELDGMEKAGPCEAHVGTRWDRVRNHLPECLFALTESNTRKGFRLVSAAWHR
jgi:hypothetical protein